jgi:hypothetical protein
MAEPSESNSLELRIHRNRGTYTMNRRGSPFFGIRTHHVVIALIAVLTAAALVSNYYLW